MVRTLLIAASTLLVAGCEKQSATYCLNFPEDRDNCPAPPEDDDDSNGCLSDACPSLVCLPEGVCAPAGSVLYVDPLGSGSECSIQNKCTLTTAFELASASRNVIKLEPATYGDGYAVATPAGTRVRVIGSGATLRRSGPGATLAVQSPSDLELNSLFITGGTGRDIGFGITCDTGAQLTTNRVRILNNEYGLSSACDLLTLRRSEIARSKNAALVVTSGVVEIEANFIYANGGEIDASTVSITASGRFRFNTIAFNTVKLDGPAPVTCNGGVDADGNIISDNLTKKKKATAPADPQIAGNCMFGGSYVLPGTGGNDLMFADPITGDLHLTTASPATVRNVAGVSCMSMIDFDGEARPRGGNCDLGGDELTE